MKSAVLFLNFGEPARPTEAEVVPFLERIFTVNAPLEARDRAGVAARAAELARERAPGLMRDYRAIGGSPLNAQARAQADATIAELRRRGHDFAAYLGMQFTPPAIEDALRAAAQDGVERIVALPVYPLCGPSTTVAALAAAADAARSADWRGALLEISGWHRHPDYIRLRADGIRRTAEGAVGKRVRLLFSAHGTPMKYLREGSRYDVYVEDCCRAVAREAGFGDYVIGYQNHSNRPIEWTQPAVERVIDEMEADAVVVDAISFMHEQSETLVELDHELRNRAKSRGIEFLRVPIPHNDGRFARVLADLVLARVADAESGEHESDSPGSARSGGSPDTRGTELRLGRCRCRAERATRCTNHALGRASDSASFAAAANRPGIPTRDS